MRNTDAGNIKLVNSIIKKYGWMGPQKVGFNAAQGLFMVIQHADLKTRELYLPMIREAEIKAEILSSNVAILEDRINMRNGKKQMYGGIQKNTKRNFLKLSVLPGRKLSV